MIPRRDVTLEYLTPLIYNPTAGRMQRSPDLVRRLTAALRSSIPDIEPAPTSRPLEAVEMAARYVREGARMIVVAGGDGTINEAANGLAGTGAALGIVPVGTANVLACELGMRGDPVRAAASAADWQPLRIAMGRLRSGDGAPRLFLLMAGAGLDARINGSVRAEVKRRFGKLAYWLAGAEMVGRRLAQMDVHVDGVSRRTGFALAARARNYGGELEIASRASLLKDRFELVTFRGRTSWRFPLYLFGALVGRTTVVPGAESFFAERLELAPANGERIEIQVDGEQAGTLPARLEIVPDALTLMVPRRYAERERNR
ncbi:MAG: diacylglycerol kinase family protein [Bryobacteraceae bacterium]